MQELHGFRYHPKNGEDEPYGQFDDESNKPPEGASQDADATPASEQGIENSNSEENEDE